MEPLDKPAPKATKKWIDLVIATTVGPNLALFAMMDPDGHNLKAQFEGIVHDIIMTGFRAMSKTGPIDTKAFTLTAQRIVLERYNQFISQRLQHLLIHEATQSILIVKGKIDG